MTAADVDAFARRVLAFHAARGPAPHAGRWTWPAALRTPRALSAPPL